jgi:hypothetical protein
MQTGQVALDGIFFDEGPAPYRFTGDSTIAYNHPIQQCVKDLYHAIYNHVKNKPARPGRPVIPALTLTGNTGGAVLLNASQYIEPGGDWIMNLADRACDIAILFEGEACKYFFQYPVSGQPAPPTWWLTSAPDRVAHTLYDCHDQSDLEAVVALSKQRNAGYVYVIDSPTANYFRLPPYWQAEITAVTGTVAAATPSQASFQFYVRDWTDTAASHDQGQEPSDPAHPFWTTSDVWNLLQAPAPTPAFDMNDQPITSNTFQVGNNWAYVRTSRNTAGSAATVAARFLWVDFGMGNLFQYVNSVNAPEYIEFTRTDLSKVLTSGHQWTIPTNHSPHVCLAVEISQGCDRPKIGLLGRAPAPLDSDPKVIAENNLAQRNLDFILIPPIPPLPPFPSMSGYAIHNGELVKRDIEIYYEATESGLADAIVEIISPRGSEKRDISMERRSRLALRDMQPGENRWIGLTFSPHGKEGQAHSITFYELAESTVLNGFTIVTRPVPLGDVIQDNLKHHAMQFTRLGAAFDSDGAAEEGEAALETFRDKKKSTRFYGKFLRGHLPMMRQIVSDLGWSYGASDPFGLRLAFQGLIATLESGNMEATAARHSQVLDKLDAFATMLQKEQGDTTDILQTVRWQQHLYATLPQLNDLEPSRRVIEEAKAFIEGYETAVLGDDAYPGLIGRLLDSFSKAADMLGKAGIGLEQDIAGMERSMDSPSKLQKANREYLLKLQALGTEAASSC